jgi:hypothetical protein
MVDSQSNYVAFSNRSKAISTSGLTAAILPSVTYGLQFTFLKSDNEPASNKTLRDVLMGWPRPTSHNESDLWLKMHQRPQFPANDDANATRLLRKDLNTAFREQRIAGPRSANPERRNPGLRPALLEQRTPRDAIPSFGQHSPSNALQAYGLPIPSDAVGRNASQAYGL